jgi:hypothetical protein
VTGDRKYREISDRMHQKSKLAKEEKDCESNRYVSISNLNACLLLHHSFFQVAAVLLSPFFHPTIDKEIKGSLTY